MVTKSGSYPVYSPANDRVKTNKSLVSFNYEQVLEIANIFYYVNKKLASVPKFLGGILLTEAQRALHKSIHDAAVNCCLSLEEADRCKAEGEDKNG